MRFVARSFAAAYHNDRIEVVIHIEKLDAHEGQKIEITFMELSELGLDRWFMDQATELCLPDQRIARVTVVDRGWYTVRNEEGEVAARATGRFLFCSRFWLCANQYYIYCKL